MPGRPEAADSEEEQDDVEYMLGFVEFPEKATDLLRHRFPSKVGGAPAWLDPVNLPTTEQLTCAATGQTMRFLLQVYCPVDDNPIHAFHRMIFLFVSPRGDLLQKAGAVKAFRCQLPRANPYYADSPAPASQQAPQPLQEDEQQLSLEHDPWRVVEVEQQVASEPAAAAAAAAGPVQFVEQELIVEPEPDEVELEESGQQQSEVQRLLSAYRARIADEGEYDESELPAELMDELEGTLGPAQQAFAAFQARTGRAPEQCLRYCFQPGSAPLWPSHMHTPKPSDIPACPHCGAARRFEFQVMPQLLSFLDVDMEDPHAPDWGTIAVYSCPASCSAAAVEGSSRCAAYTEEFVWVQPS